MKAITAAAIAAGLAAQVSASVCIIVNKLYEPITDVHTGMGTK